MSKTKKQVKKRRPYNAYYSVYDLNDNIVFTGRIYEICKRLFVVKSTVTKALNNNGLIGNEYRIRPEYVEEDKDNYEN